MRKTAVNQLSSYRRRWQTVSVKVFFSFLFKWVWSYTEGVSKSIRVCSLSPAADSPQDYLTHTRDRNQPFFSGLPVSQWSHRAIVVFTSSPNISSVLPLDLKEAFQDRMSAKATPCPGEERWLWILRQMTLWGEKAPSLNSPVWLGIQTLCRTSAVTVPLTECHTHYTPSGWFSCWFAYQRVGYKRVFDLTLENKEFNSMPFDFVAP